MPEGECSAAQAGRTGQRGSRRLPCGSTPEISRARVSWVELRFHLQGRGCGALTHSAVLLVVGSAMVLHHKPPHERCSHSIHVKSCGGLCCGPALIFSACPRPQLMRRTRLPRPCGGTLSSRSDPWGQLQRLSPYRTSALHATHYTITKNYGGVAHNAAAAEARARARCQCHTVNLPDE